MEIFDNKTSACGKLSSRMLYEVDTAPKKSQTDGQHQGIIFLFDLPQGQSQIHIRRKRVRHGNFIKNSMILFTEISRNVKVAFIYTAICYPFLQEPSPCISTPISNDSSQVK